MSKKSQATVTLLAVCVALLDSSPLLAEKPDSTWGWNLFVGVHGYSEESELGDDRASSVSNSAIIGLRLWQRLSSWASLEAELPLGVTTSRDQIATVLVSMPRLQARYSPRLSWAVEPSAVIGAGVPLLLSSDSASVPSDVVGGGYLGLAGHINLEGLRVGLEGRYVVVPASGDALAAHEWELLLTVNRRPRHVEASGVDVPQDRDGDSVSDNDDKCPERREDMDGFEDGDGCPELDNDADGVIDGLDQCQDKDEIYNGFEDADGCPDEVSDDVRLLEGIIMGLRFDAGSGVMDYDNLSELDRVAAVLLASPSVRVSIVGHCDDREGLPEVLEEISDERARSVRQYLVQRGVGPGRLLPFGSGATSPFADNGTASGRRANRRVEILIHRDDPRAP